MPHTALTYLLLLGLAIAIPLLLLLGALMLQSAWAQREQLENQVSQVLDALVNDLDREFDRDMTILNTLATSQALASADWPAFYDQAKAGLQGRAYLVLVDADGRQLVNTYVPYGQQPAMTGDPETLRRMAQTKAPVVSNLFVSLVANKPVFNISIPILHDGELRYVMSLGLLPEDLAALLASQRLGPEWVTMIWDTHGVILARSRDSARYIGTPVPPNIRENERRAVVRTTNLDGADVLYATTRSLVSGWGIGVNVPYSLISRQMRNSLLVWGAIALLAIGFALALGLRFARQITTSLSAASKAAAAFGQGRSFPITSSRLAEANAFLATLRNAHEERERAERALMETLKRQSSLYRFVDKLHRAKTQEEIRDAALDAILRALRCDRASILLRDNAGMMRFVGWRGLSEKYRKAVEGHSPWASDESNPQPICIEDIDRADVADFLKATVKAENLQALAFIPLTSGGKLVGKFMTYYDAPHVFSDDEIQLALAIARQLRVSIEKKRTEDELRESEQRLQIALNAGRMGAWEWNIGTGEVFWSPGLQEIHGLKPGEFGGMFEDFTRDIHPEDLESVLAQTRQTVESRELHHLVYRLKLKDGGVRWLEAFGNFVPASDGGEQKLAGVCMDITDRKRAEEREKLLAGELQHRTKNLFSVVQALALQSFQGNHTLDEAGEAFVGRLQTLARADQRLTNSAWQGTRLEEVVRSELEPFAGRFEIKGEEILLAPQAAQNFALALHELATNASKHGALSAADGKIAIAWTNGSAFLRFRWEEHGGPQVSGPIRSGFGTSLLKATLGEARIEYASAGLIYEVDVPLSAISPSLRA